MPKAYYWLLDRKPTGLLQNSQLHHPIIKIPIPWWNPTKPPKNVEAQIPRREPCFCSLDRSPRPGMGPMGPMGHGSKPFRPLVLVNTHKMAGKWMCKNKKKTCIRGIDPSPDQTCYGQHMLHVFYDIHPAVIRNSS